MKADSWIYNLNIGNVMHLSPMSINDLVLILESDSMKTSNHEEESNHHLGSADTMISPDRTPGARANVDS
jgi:hypothetical protein